jgi:hypothetical protein
VVGKRSRAQDRWGPTGPPTSVLTALKYICKIYIYLKHVCFVFFINGKFYCILSLIHLIDRTDRNEPPLDAYEFAIQCNKCTLTVNTALWFHGQG